MKDLNNFLFIIQIMHKIWPHIHCPNTNCKEYNKVGAGNIVSDGHDRNGVRKFLCNSCNHSFNETKDTPFFHKHLNKQELIEIIREFAREESFRSVAKKTHHHLDTISKLDHDIEKHPEGLKAFLLNEVKLTEEEIKHFWGFIKSHRKFKD